MPKGPVRWPLLAIPSATFVAFALLSWRVWVWGANGKLGLQTDDALNLIVAVFVAWLGILQIVFFHWQNAWAISSQQAFETRQLDDSRAFQVRTELAARELEQRKAIEQKLEERLGHNWKEVYLEGSWDEFRGAVMGAGIYLPEAIRLIEDIQNAKPAMQAEDAKARLKQSDAALFKTISKFEDALAKHSDANNPLTGGAPAEEISKQVQQTISHLDAMNWVHFMESWYGPFPKELLDDFPNIAELKDESDKFQSQMASLHERVEAKQRKEAEDALLKEPGRARSKRKAGKKT